MSIQTVISIYEEYATRAVVLLAGTLAASLFLYGTFLLLAVQHTAARAATERDITAVNTRLSELERRYLSQTRGFTLQSAVALGFVPSSKVVTIFLDAKNSTLTLRGQ